MRWTLLVSSLVALAIGLAACGSGSSRSASSSKTSPSAANSAGSLRIYRVGLTGATAEAPAGAPQGTGAAVIAFHGSSRVCWRFAHLHGFINATVAHIHAGAQGKSGKVVVSLSTGPRLHHEGCVPVSPVVVKAIEGHPSGYYVNIHSKQYPNGAVRAQL